MAESSIGFNGQNVSHLFSYTSALFSFDQTLFSFLPFSLQRLRFIYVLRPSDP
jgi:hypothetical protein